MATPQYVVLYQTWLRTDDCAVEQMHPIGSVINYSGDPSSSLAALNREALERKRAALAKLNQIARPLWERNERRYRAALPSWAKEILETAQLDVRVVPSTG